MKRITFLLILLITSLGFSQTNLSETGAEPNVEYFGNSAVQSLQRAPCLYVQPRAGTPNGYSYTSAEVGRTVADDFDVSPGEIFTPDGFIAPTLLFNPNTIVSADITFFADAGGLPGAVLFTLPSQVPVSQPIVGTAFGRDILDVTFDLTGSGVSLCGGVSGAKYWVGLSNGIETSGSDNPFWEATDTVTGNESAYNSPGSTGGVWQPGSIPFGVPRDMVMLLSGDCSLNSPPALTCPADVTIPNGPGQCGSVVVFSPPIGTDFEDGFITSVQTGGPASGTLFPVGPNVLTFEVTDSCGLTATCSYTITVEDTEDPVAVCTNITVQLDPSGMGGITLSDLDGGSTDNCAIFFVSASQVDFTCADVGVVEVIYTVQDEAGNSNSCTATVTVEDNVAPTASCIDTSGGGTTTGTETASYAGAPQSWPDTGGGSTGLVATLTADVTGIPASATILDVDVAFDIDHSWTGDLDISLVSPDGSTVQILDNQCSLQDNVTAIFDDAAGAVVCNTSSTAGPHETCPGDYAASATIDGTYQPFAPLSSFNGELASGTWTLLVSDTVGGDGGCIPNFSVTVDWENVSGPLDVFLDASGNASITPGDIDNGSSDACGIASITVSPDTFTCADVGINTVTLTVTDVNGNVSTCTADVNVIDDIPPVAICQDVTVQLDSAGNGSITTADIDNGSNDACGIASLSLDIDTFTCADLGPNTVTLTVTDNNGNVSTCTATVTVEDNIPPTALCTPFTVQLDAAGNGSITPGDVDGGSSDNCGIASITVSPNTFDCSNVGPNTVTLTVTDTSGNVTTCTTTVTVEDNVAPTASCIDTSGGGTTSGTETASYTGAPQSWPDTGGGSTGLVATLTADVTGIPASATILDVDVAFDIDHSWTGDLDISLVSPDGSTVQILDNQCSLQDNVTAIFDDAAGAVVCNTSSTAGPHETCPGDYASSATIDGTYQPFAPLSSLNGELASGTWTLFVSDTVGGDGGCIPNFSVTVDWEDVGGGGPLDVFLDASGNASITPGDIDNGSSDACGIASITVSPDTFTCADVGINTVTLTVTDVNGNVSTCTAEVNVIDNIPPVAVCQDITVQLDATGNASITPGDIDNGSSDACGIDTLALDIDTFDCSDVGTPVVVTLTVTDVNGNVSTCTATVTVEDNIPPEIVCPADIVVDNDPGICGAVVDYEGGSQSIIFSESFTQGVPSGDCGTWNAFQSQLLNGLSYTSVTFSGTNDPVGISMTDPAKVLQLADALRTNSSVTIVDGPNTWRTGGCGGGTELSVNQSICFCNNPGYSIRPCIGNSNWGGANTATCGGPSQTLTVEFVHTVGSGPIVGTDNCPGSVTVQTAGLPSGSVFPVGTTTNTFVVTDASGNTATCSFDVTVNDTEPPLISCPLDISADTDPGVCFATVLFPDALALDNCDVDSVVQTGGLPSGSDFPLGVSVVEFTATDIYGNSSVCTFTITVSDNEDPIAVCQDITIELDEFGDASIVPGDIDNGSSDNCAIDFLTLDITDFDCDDVGDNVVTLTVVDESGNSSQCTAIVTVEDNIAPVLVCEGEPATLTGTTSASPGLPIPDGDPAGISTTMTVTDEFDITDLDVHLDISHTWVGDLIVTIESPAGTSVTIVDRMGVPASTFGCAEDDLDITLDDEAADPIEDECSGSPINGSFIPNNALSAFDGESTLGDWILTVSDNATPDPGVINEWGITYSYDTSGAPYVVELDANGMATVDVSDLVNVQEACGWIATVGGGGGAPGSITTLFATNNGGALGGAVYFDVTVGAEDLELTDIDVNTEDPGAITMDVYALVGSYVGNEGDMSAWTLQTSGSGTAAGVDNPSNVVLDSSITLTAGESYGMALVFTSAHGHNYTNGDGTNENYDNGDLALALGAASNVPFDGSPFSPRIWNGSLNYFVGSAPSTTIDFTCDDLGINEIEITVTDDSGNTATCTATVEVLDVTAPVLVCADVTIELDEDGVVEIDPQDLLANSPSTYQVITISSDNGSAAEGFTDFTVNVTDADTVSFDWDFDTADSPAWDSFGYLLNGVYTELTDPAGANQQSGNSGPINVAPGDVFGFRSYSADGLLGAATTTISNFVPGFTGQFDPANWILDLVNSDGDAYFVEIPGGPLSFDACGITIWAVDVTEVTCADIGTPIVITVFASDASGNIASCQSTVTVVDLLGPEVVCPEDQTQDPGPGNLYWEVPDYWANGEASATDNCTDPVVVTSQDPAPGTLLPDGVYTVTICAEDEYSNETCCTFELTIESVLGIDDNDINFGSIIMYPNPARDIVNLNNPQSLALDQAAIYDLTGRLVQTIDLRDMGTDIAIDISQLASATYMVLINGENGHITKQLIKE